MTSDGKWEPDPWGMGERRRQSSSGVWSRWVADGVNVREAPLPERRGSAATSARLCASGASRSHQDDTADP